MVEHKPVLLKEAVEALNVQEGKKYIDATLGLGGHSIEILKKGGIVLGFDINEESIKLAVKKITEQHLEKNFRAVKENFKNIDKISAENGFTEVSGIIYDLGYSSFELEESGLGLSFQKEEPLDMRMDESLGVTAADLLNTLPEDQITRLISTLSDEKLAKKYASAIVKFRSLKRFETTKELADLLKSQAPPNYENGRIHPATRTFQALRIAVNDELENLRLTLPRAAHIILPSGVLVIISFQSLEDKVVKNFGHSAQPNLVPLFKKPLTPSDAEILENPRSRSAKLRAFKKQNA